MFTAPPDFPSSRLRPPEPLPSWRVIGAEFASAVAWIVALAFALLLFHSFVHRGESATAPTAAQRHVEAAGVTR